MTMTILRENNGGSRMQTSFPGRQHFSSSMMLNDNSIAVSHVKKLPRPMPLSPNTYGKTEEVGKAPPVHTMGALGSLGPRRPSPVGFPWVPLQISATRIMSWAAFNQGFHLRWRQVLMVPYRSSRMVASQNSLPQYER